MSNTPQPSDDWLRTLIVKHTSEMLDNPGDLGIYPTTKFYNNLEAAITQHIQDEVKRKVQLRVKTRLWTPKGYDQYDKTWEPQDIAPRQKLKIPLDAYGKSFVEIELKSPADKSKDQ